MADSVRADVLVPNESDAFVFTSAILRGRGLEPGSDPWRTAVGECRLLPLAVESEDPAIVRIVVGAPLEPQEQAEWIGRVDGGLRVPDGRLALCGGAAYVLDAGDWTAEYVRTLPVPPGDYHATLYCFVSAPNAHACLEAAGAGEPLGAWFRRSRPGEAMPAWLHNRCASDPSEDPGHEREWARAGEQPGAEVVDFLLHLTPANGPPTPVAVSENGFAEPSSCRKPEPFPRGIAATVAAEAREPVPEPTARVAGEGTTAGADAYAPQAVTGGPVDVPLAKLARVFRIAWMCDPYTLPELRIQVAGLAPFEPPECAEHVDVRVAGRQWQFVFKDRGQQDEAADALVAIARQLGGLPDGSRIELDTARPRHAKGPRPPGLHRYRGVVEGGCWRVTEAYPAVDAGILAEALVLTTLAEGPRVFIARDESEAKRVLARVEAHAADFLAGNALQRAGTELTLARRNPAAMTQVALRAFWLRYADIWPLHDHDIAER
jgi:hypothetical protein